MKQYFVENPWIVHELIDDDTPVQLYFMSSLKRHQIDVRALHLQVTWCTCSFQHPSSDVNLMTLQWWRTKMSHWGHFIISPCFPFNSLRAISWPVEGGKEPCWLKMSRHPLQDISVGDCTVLLGDLGVLTFLLQRMVTCLITILPLCVFFVRKNCHTLYLISRSPILICPN